MLGICNLLIDSDLERMPDMPDSNRFNDMLYSSNGIFPKWFYKEAGLVSSFDLPLWKREVMPTGDG